jgi:hypothetical protein
MDATRSALEQALAPQGLRVLGGFVPAAQEALPPLPLGAAPAVVWLIGQVGSEVWPAFAASRFAGDGLPDPMDRWSQSVGDALAAAGGGLALYPSDGPPWWPFQQWMARCLPGQTSPLMLRLHPEFGLWQACRFALALPRIDPQDRAALQAPPAVDLCAACAGQPCLQACPVSAFGPTGLDVQACSDHLLAPAGEGDECLQRGCLARRACPVGAQHRYQEAHAAFHMAAFADRRRGPVTG